MSDDEKVGYGRPPKQHRFSAENQPRRKGKAVKQQTLSMTEVIGKALSTRRRIRRGDKVVSMAAGEILIERLVQMMLNGSARDLIKVMELVEKHQPAAFEQKSSAITFAYEQAATSKVRRPQIKLLGE